MKGLNEVSLTIVKFNSIEKELLQQPSDFTETREVQSELELQVVKLFSVIIEYQAKALRYNVHSSGAQVLRDVFNTNDWKNMLEQINEAKASCEVLVARIKDDRYQGISDRQVRDQYKASHSHRLTYIGPY